MKTDSMIQSKPCSRVQSVGRWLTAAALGVAVNFAVPLVTTTVEPVLGETALGKVQAQDKKKQATRRTPAIRAKVFEKLNEAQLLAEEKKYNEALGKLNELRDKEGRGALNSYELANLFNLYAFIYFTQEDYNRALGAYEEVIKQPDIPYAMEVNTKFTIAQLYFVKEDWKKGVDTLLNWFKLKEELGEPVGANAHALLSQGYYQLGNQRKSLEHVEIAINDYKSKGKIPKEQWWGLQRYLYFEKNDIRKVVDILEETLKYYQKKAYWQQLAAMYGELKREKDMVSAMETAYVQNLLEKEKELINMAYLFLSIEVPYKAAKVIDKGIKAKQIDPTSKNLELLANSWRQAQEIKKAIPEMRAAAAKSDKGELWTRLGNIYLDNDEFEKAAEAVRNGLQKGGVKRPDSAQLVLGMAEFNLKNYDAARKAFREAKKNERSQKYAEQWLEFMERELAREKALAQDV
ncbi:tetratricopeptide repeat protein [Litorivivens sp.]|uniref:tetratricopeptide repeat protein n=1 Tax=Litorivivens sp. TaxID=2020868 RepID=UPI003563E768